jgi:pseudouridine synthase
MARAGVASRRQSEELILKGQVKVNGRVVRELGVKVDPDAAVIEVMGRRVNPQAAKAYMVLNKPAGFLTTVADPFGRPTVMGFVRDLEQNLFPVGRLDLNSEGLLLLTNDGDLAYRLTHPKHKAPKTYVVTVRGRPTSAAVWKLRQGVDLEDGKTQPARVRILEKGPGTTALEITISEGRKRQIRRMCQAIGYPVKALKRIAVGPLKLGDLKTGSVRRLSDQELSDLKRAVGLY